MGQVTVSRELLRQAIDAMSGVAEWVELRPKTHPWDAFQKLDPAITALRTALEQPAFAERTAVEPLAWMTFDGEGGYELRLYEANESYRDDFIRRNGERYADWVTPLYAAPQAQEKS